MSANVLLMKIGRDCQAIGVNSLSQISRGANFQSDDLEPEDARRCLNINHLAHGARSVGIGHDRHPMKIRDNLAQNFELFGGKIGMLIG